MKGETQDEPERNSRGAVWVWLCWLALAVVLYVLSFGPVVMMEGKNLLREGSPADRVLVIIYLPVYWVYDDTPLRKPLGMYLHLWAPNYWDGRGKEK